MFEYVIAAPPQPFVPVSRGGRFPVRRIFCVGRNYAEHAREMGGDPQAEPPFFFTKPADAVVESGAVLPFPVATADLHHEAELVVVIESPVSEERYRAMFHAMDAVLRENPEVGAYNQTI